MKKKITIRLINFSSEIDVDSYRNFLPEEGRRFLKNEIIYEYDEKSTIKDLFTWLLSQIEPDSLTEDDYLIGKILGYCDNCREFLYLYCNLENYIQTNAINNTLFFDYQLCVGGTVRIEGLVKIWIHSREQGHSGYPHVHLSKPKSKEPPVSFSLEKMEPITSEFEKAFYKTFSKNERTEILEVLSKNKEQFRTFYENIKNGSTSICIEIDYKGEIYILH